LLKNFSRFIGPHVDKSRKSYHWDRAIGRKEITKDNRQPGAPQVADLAASTLVGEDNLSLAPSMHWLEPIVLINP
jgi:hypothetical protein